MARRSAAPSTVSSIACSARTERVPDGDEVSVERPGRPPVRIRLARREDVPAIVRLLADDPLGARREQPGEPLTAAYEDAFRAIDGDPRQHLVVADKDGDVVATLQLTLLPYLTYGGGWRGQVEAVRVARDERGSGLGGELLRWAIAAAREHGCHVVQLTTDKARPEALRFYESLGFRASHEGMKLHLDGVAPAGSGIARSAEGGQSCGSPAR